MSRASSRCAEMSNLSGRREFEGEMMWSLVKVLFWVAVGYWIRSHGSVFM